MMTWTEFQLARDRVAVIRNNKLSCRIENKLIVLFLLLTIVVLFLPTPVPAAEAHYRNPKVFQIALDFCQQWGRNCGQPAADAYCRQKGYRRALAFNVKYDTPPTRIISSNQVCQAPGCDRIDYVVCEAEAVFTNPIYGQYPLDFCFHWGKNCGKPAADGFCRSKGYNWSVDFAVRPDFPPTRVIGTGQVCNQPYCDRIVLVTCKDRKGGGSAGGLSGGKGDDAGDAATVSDPGDAYGLFEE
jgi:hypothetical protein